MLGKHLLGIYEKALPEDMDWDDRFRLAASLGFDYVEISVDESDQRIARLYWSDPEKARFRRALLNAGMPLQSLCLSAHRLYPFGSSDRATRQMAYEIMERAIHFAQDFGIRVIQLAGYDVYYEPSTPESLEAFHQGLAWACELASQYQVMLSMEIMDTKLMSSISRYLRYSKSLGCPWFSVYPDIGNLSAWRDNDVFRELELGRQEIVAVHIKETLAQTEDHPAVFRRVPFGTGCVDFKNIFAKLEDLGYRGPYTIEMWREDDWQSCDAVRQAKAFVEEQFALGVSA